MNLLENVSAKVLLKPGREKSLRNRHPWLFSGAVARLEGQAAPGDIIRVFSSTDQLLGKGFWNPKSQIRLRMLTFGNEIIDREFFEKRLLAAAALRTAFMDEGTSAYRAVHAEGDRLPGLVVDRYGEVLVAQFNTLGMQRIRTLIVELLQAQFQPAAILERSESTSLRSEGCEVQTGWLAGKAQDTVDITENGIRFRVDILHGQKTGFFLDQRENRQLTAAIAAGSTMLNCFSYSGGFSVYAALQGTRTHSVDSSAAALDLARENFALNGLDLTDHRFTDANVFEFLRENKDTEDVIVLDPPAFVRHRSQLEKGARGYKDINRLAMKRLKPGGFLLSCSCSAFVDAALFRKIIYSAAQESGRFVQVLAQPGHSPDHPVSIFHPEGEYLKTLLLRVDD